MNSSKVPYNYDRAAAQAWAVWTLAQPHLVILDTETTGLERNAEVISLAMINRDGHELLNVRMQPRQIVPHASMRIHGITNRDLVNMPTLADWYRQILPAFSMAHVVIYNADFDTRVINQSAELFNLPPVKLPVGRCVMEAFAAYWGNWSEYHGSYRWQKLTHAADWAGHTYIAHDALADCRATLAVLQAMAANKPV